MSRLTAGVLGGEVHVVVGRTGAAEQVRVGRQLTARLALAPTDHLLRREAGVAVCVTGVTGVTVVTVSGAVGIRDRRLRWMTRRSQTKTTQHR